MHIRENVSVCEHISKAFHVIYPHDVLTDSIQCNLKCYWVAKVGHLNERKDFLYFQELIAITRITKEPFQNCYI